MMLSLSFLRRWTSPGNDMYYGSLTLSALYYDPLLTWHHILYHRTLLSVRNQHMNCCHSSLSRLLLPLYHSLRQTWSLHKGLTEVPVCSHQATLSWYSSSDLYHLPSDFHGTRRIPPTGNNLSSALHASSPGYGLLPVPALVLCLLRPCICMACTFRQDNTRVLCFAPLHIMDSYHSSFHCPVLL